MGDSAVTVAVAVPACAFVELTAVTVAEFAVAVMAPEPAEASVKASVLTVGSYAVADPCGNPPNVEREGATSKALAEI